MVKMICYGPDQGDSRVKVHLGSGKPGIEIFENMFSDLPEFKAFMAELNAAADDFEKAFTEGE